MSDDARLPHQRAIDELVDAIDREGARRLGLTDDEAVINRPTVLRDTATGISIRLASKYDEWSPDQGGYREWLGRVRG